MSKTHNICVSDGKTNLVVSICGSLFEVTEVPREVLLHPGSAPTIIFRGELVEHAHGAALYSMSMGEPVSDSLAAVVAALVQWANESMPVVTRTIAEERTISCQTPNHSKPRPQQN